MEWLKKTPSIFLLTGILLLVGILSFKTMTKKERSNLKTNISSIEKGKKNTSNESKYDLNYTDEIDDKSEKEEEFLVSENMKLRFIYDYVDEGKKEKTEQRVSGFMVGKTIDEIDNIFASWDVLKYDKENITLTKEFRKTKNEYIVGIENNFVAIYKIENGEKNLMQVTETPISTLHENDQIMLENGINVEDEYSLFKILEDYET